VTTRLRVVFGVAVAGMLWPYRAAADWSGAICCAGGGVFGVAAQKRARCFAVRSGEAMDGIRWAGELGPVGRWKGRVTPGMAKSKANLPPVATNPHQTNST